jgi:hypothetical protein
MDRRQIAMVGVAVSGVVALAGLGGAGGIAVAQYQYGAKVTICHNAGPHGKQVTITVSQNALPAHLRHGDELGPCPD